MAEKNQQLKLQKYSYEFLKYLNKFIVKGQLVHTNQRAVVAISGGVDSVALAYSIYLLSKLEFEYKVLLPRFIHIDHGTRAEILQEKSALKKWSESLGVQFKSIKINLNMGDSNFESLARSARYDIFHDELTDDEVLLTAHHIDDSFEWSLMQSFKSGGVKASLGIPLKSSRLVRPFLCMTKDQIIRFAKEQELEWFEDKSNNDLKFERNYIRDFIEKNIRPKYPQYLKHYVHRQNELASKLGVSAFSSKNISKTKFRVYKRQWGSIVKTPKELCVHDKELLSLIVSHSTNSRGKTQAQYEKLINLINKNNSFVGPFSFSGGLKIYYHQGHLFILKKNEELQLYSRSTQIPGLLPLFKKSNKKNTLKSPVAMALTVTQEFIEKSVPFHFAWRVEKGETLIWI